MVCLRRDGVKTAGHRNHRDRRDRETRAVWDSESRPTCTQGMRFFVDNAVLSRDPLSQGRLVADPSCQGARDKGHPKTPKRHRRGSFPAYQGPRRIVLGRIRMCHAEQNAAAARNSDTKSPGPTS